MSSLYELTQDVLYLQGLLEDGEIDEQTYKDTVEGMCVDGKLENICKVIKNLESKADAYGAEISRMQSRKKTLDNSVKRLKESMLTYMLTSNTKKIEAGLFALSVGASKSVEVWDKSRVPEEFLFPQEIKVDKIGIAKAIKNGEIIDGCEMVEKPFLTLR